MPRHFTVSTGRLVADGIAPKAVKTATYSRRMSSLDRATLSAEGRLVLQGGVEVRRSRLGRERFLAAVESMLEGRAPA
jgi:hypothetical protein